jgi:UDP-4-amino-4,6-dideoxy-N-acetyl-beta-L-altrosamine transaminase
VISYGRPSIDEADIEAVVRVLRSPWLTTGPLVGEFEKAFAGATGSSHAVSFANGTAALHATMHAYGVGAGDEVIVAANTFVASANCVLYEGAQPVFADVEESTLLIDATEVEAKITPRTKGLIAVDYAGQPCDYDALGSIAKKHGLFLHADACHALGAAYHGKPVGSLAKTSSFSFHPVKPITTGEGGMVTTDDADFATKLRTFRGHGISSDFRSREAAGTWEYDMAEIGYNYRLTDLQCALGISQLSRLPSFHERRNFIANRYDAALAGVSWLTPPVRIADRTHAFHLYVCRIAAGVSQREAFQKLRDRGIGVHVMYRPVYLHSYYRETLGFPVGLCPVAERAYENMLVLPLNAAMSDADVDRVIEEVVAFEK